MKKILLILLAILFCCSCDKSEQNIELVLLDDTTDNYEWSYVIENKDVLLNMNDLSVNTGSIDNTDEKFVNKYYSFKPLTKGNTNIKFTYSNGDDVLYEMNYDIKVKGNLKVNSATADGNYFEDEILPQLIIK